MLAREILPPAGTVIGQRTNEGLPEMPRASQCSSLLFKIFSVRAVRLKTVEIYCDFCSEDVVFSKVCFDNVLV
jgi:hypothetical protein